MTHAIASSTTEFSGSGGTAIPCRLWRPADDARFPGIVLVSEMFGLTSEMERIGTMVASWGYVVLAPDLFADGWFRCLRALVRDLGRGGGASSETLRLGRDFLAGQPFVDDDALGVLGFCMGGGFALLLAKKTVFQVAAAFYGQTPASMDGACPVTASFGGRDPIYTRPAANLAADLDRAGVPNDIKVYPDAGHAFMTRAPNPVIGAVARFTPIHAAYNEAAAADATERLQRFLGEHLGIRAKWRKESTPTDS